jgi:hypothetical protein
MSFKLIARIENVGNGGFLAYIDSIKGMVEQEETPEMAMKELLISLKVKMAFDLGIGYDDLKDTVINPLEEYKIERIDFNNQSFVERDINVLMNG